MSNESMSEFAIARIDAQDVSFILPIREFLESHGVVVFVNSVPDDNYIYHIVCGEREFVEEIFSRTANHKEKVLKIIVNGVEKRYSHDGSKLVLVDATLLTPGEISQLFEFYFTGDTTQLDLRKNPLPHIPPPQKKTPAVHAPIEDDTRIRTIIADVYKEKTHKKVSRRHKNIFRWVFIGIACVLMPILWYMLSIGLSGVTLYKSAQTFTNGNIQTSRNYNQIARYWIIQARFIHSVAPIASQERLITFLSHSSDALGKAHDIADLGQQVANHLVKQADVSSTGQFPASDIRAIRNNLVSTQTLLGLAQAELVELLSDRTFPFSIRPLTSIGDRVVLSLVTLRRSLSDMDNMLMLFSRIAGFKEPQTFLILLQNSFELRPTGGFIGSIALASISDGRLTNLSVEDVYTLDGQLKGHVDPPKPLKELLGVEHWYLRDSNWDVDFERAATRAQWFYEKESGRKVDGVIAINTPFIIEILRVIGPLELTDYNDRITAENFYGKAIYYTQNNFFPGSTQKKDFLGSLLNALIVAVTENPRVHMTRLFRGLTTSLYQHDIMMMFPDPSLQSLVTHFGWAGKVPTSAGCEGTNPSTCAFAPLILNEANLGVNKVNYLVSRSIRRRMTIKSDGKISEQITLTIKNAAGRDEPHSYRVYLRVVLPKTASVSQVTIDGAIIPTRGTTGIPVVPYIEMADPINGNTVLGIAFDILASHQNNIDIMFDTQTALAFDVEGAWLDMYIQKQPGIEATPITTIIEYPTSWIAGIERKDGIGDTLDLIAKSGQLQYNTILNADIRTRIRFTK